MFNQIALRIAAAAFALAVPAAQAEEPATELATVQVETGVGGPLPNVIAPGHAVLAEIAGWLAQNSDLPAAAEDPRIRFVKPRVLIAIRYKGLIGSAKDQSGETPAAGIYQREVAAVYEDATRTIFLPETWTGSTAAEMSVLVHEMVHHLQNLAGLKYECPAAREKPAYRAQDRWLAQHGLDLEQEFELDRFTIFVSSTCLG
jgi:hypothetical protein